MKKGEKKFLILFVVLFIAYVATDFLAPRPINWTVTFSNKDKNPFGAYILSERSEDLFNEGFDISNQTISELSQLENLLILAEDAQIAGADYRSMMGKLDSGVNVFISANRFAPVLQDSLSFELSFSFHVLNQTLFEVANSRIQLSDSSEYEYPFSLVSNYFILEDESEWQVLATLQDKPIVISRKFGEGNLILNSTPYIFTNFGLLFNENYEGAAKILSELSNGNTHYTLFYHLGRSEASTPLRYFLRQPPLRWSLYLALYTVIVFLVITSRRSQRPVPVITPPANSTVHYVKTLGALFYGEKNHKKAAQRLVNYFLRDLRERYFLQIDYSEKFYKHLSAKSGVEINKVIQTFELILKVREMPQINEKTLLDLSKKIEQFK